ncbi:MAG: hypothetical protein ACR2H1_01635, partial [Limisphaerales bacterium]
STNQVLAIRCDNFDYNTNAANFREKVRVQFLEETNLNGTLACEFLRIHLVTNQIETIFANTNVVLEQLRDPANTNLIKKGLSCEQLTIDRSPQTGFLKKIVAQKKVEAEQLERSGAAKPVEQKIKAELMTVNFSAVTNQVENFVAERNVFFQKELNQATGQYAVYQMMGTNKNLKRTGRPEARTDKILIRGADSLFWDGKKFKMLGGKITPLISSNLPHHLSPNK